MSVRHLAPVLLAAALAACAKAQARTTPVVPLEVPPAPPRVIAAAPPPDTAPPVVEEPAPPVTPPARSGQPPAGRPSVPATPVEPSPRPSTPAEPPRPALSERLLQTPQTADGAEAERRIRDVLRRATQSLERVNPATLSADTRTQYETARRFLQQAREALAAGHLVYASYLADKAETLAAGLSGR